MPDCQEQHCRPSRNRIYFRSFRRRLRFTPPPPSGYPHFAVFAAHSFTSFRNCSAGATIPKPQAWDVRVSAHVKYPSFASAKSRSIPSGMQIPKPCLFHQPAEAIILSMSVNVFSVASE